jgi:hypothetical protein
MVPNALALASGTPGKHPQQACAELPGAEVPEFSSHAHSLPPNDTVHLPRRLVTPPRSGATGRFARVQVAAFAYIGMSIFVSQWRMGAQVRAAGLFLW